MKKERSEAADDYGPPNEEAAKTRDGLLRGPTALNGTMISDGDPQAAFLKADSHA